MTDRTDPIEHVGPLTPFAADELQRRVTGPHAICICGSPRGGNSAIALFVRELGVFMGNAGSLNHEEVELPESLGRPEAFERRVRDYDAEAQVWVFKAPKTTQHLLRLEQVSRNPVAVVRSMISWEKGVRPEWDAFVRLLGRALQAYHRWVEALRELEAPVIAVDYEIVLADPATFADAFITRLGLCVDDEARPRAITSISSPGYKRVSQRAQ
jgi:hypothetical protein